MGKILSGTSDKNNTLAGAISDRAQAGFVLDGGKGSHRLDRHPDDRKMVTLCTAKTSSPSLSVKFAISDNLRFEERG